MIYDVTDHAVAGMTTFLERCPYAEHHREIEITLEHLQRLQALLNAPPPQTPLDLIRRRELKRSILFSTVPMQARR